MHTLLTETKAWLKWCKRRWWVVYLFLLAYSHAVVWIDSRTPRYESGAARPKTLLSPYLSGNSGQSASRFQTPVAASHDERSTPQRMSVCLWHGSSVGTRAPVILLHGSPGQGFDFERVARELTRSGYTVYAPDLPGFGDSSGVRGAYSIFAHADALAQFMDNYKIDRAHLVGWSMGGGVALALIDLLGDKAQHRIATLTLMASLGLQEAEGSGDYHFEHFKYAVGYAALVVAPELIPHFGLLGARSSRHAFIRNFWDTDQRPLRDIMQRVTVPTLILHGRRDILVPARAAELHHELIPTSRLVMLDANHFLPFLQPEESSRYLIEHFKRHDAPGVAPETGILDLAPRPNPRTWLDRLLARSEPVLWSMAWPAELAAIAALMLLSPVLTVVICGVLVSHQQLDWFEALVGLCAGWGAQVLGLHALARVLGSRACAIPILGPRLPRISTTDWRRRLEASPVRAGLLDQFVPARRPRAPWASGLLRLGALPVLASRLLGIGLWSLWALLVYLVMARPVLNVLSERLGGIGALLGLVCAYLLVSGLLLLLTRSGRYYLRARLARITAHEFWPAWLFYAPVALYTLHLARKHRGLMLPSCCNPGIEAGGGLVGESKHAIMTTLAEGLGVGSRGALLPTFLIPPATAVEARVAHVEALIGQRPDLLDYPVVLKPDQGQRGHAVRLIQSSAELAPYFESMRRAAILQPYHPGPCEAGILWARDPAGSRGRILSITRKTFPVLVGDGRRTLEQLIESHPRYRCQAAVYLQRFADRASEVVERGREVRLAVSGNHCQGTLFTDGGDLITPALEAAVDEMARRFGASNGHAGLLDFGRFDVRYSSDEDLRDGRGFAVLELNGTMSESTNLYDPARSLFWAYGVLFRQWRTLYELGAQRRAAGARALTFRELLSMVREHYRGRDGPALAD